MPKVSTKSKTVNEVKEINLTPFQGEYLYANGKRKTSIAQVRLYKKGDGQFIINGLAIETYIPVKELRTTILSPLTLTGTENKFNISVVATGGGVSGQSEAIRHGIARGLIKFDAELRPTLKKAGYLKRDPREKERKKPGLKRARRAPQWNKR